MPIKVRCLIQPMTPAPWIFNLVLLYSELNYLNNYESMFFLNPQTLQTNRKRDRERTLAQSLTQTGLGRFWIRHHQLPDSPPPSDVTPHAENVFAELRTYHLQRNTAWITSLSAAWETEVCNPCQAVLQPIQGRSHALEETVPRKPSNLKRLSLLREKFIRCSD